MWVHGEVYQKHFLCNVYNNRNDVHSHQIYSQFQEGTMMTKENLFMSLIGNFRCQVVYSLHGDLAKIALLLCVTGLLHLYQTWQIWVFWCNQPYYWKRGQLQYPTTLLVDVGILRLLVYHPHRLLVRNRMYTWLNKRRVLVLNITNKQRRKLTTL